MSKFFIISPKEVCDLSGQGGPTAGSMSGTTYEFVNGSTTGGGAIFYVPSHWLYVSVHAALACTSGSGDAVFQGGVYGAAQQDPITATFTTPYAFQNAKIADHIATNVAAGIDDVRGGAIQIVRLGGDGGDTLSSSVLMGAIFIRNSDAE